MNLRRFVAVNSRQALREVRDALGGDAVILSNRPIEGGVEILAAASGDLSRLTSPGTQGTLKQRTASESPLTEKPIAKAARAAMPLRQIAPIKNEPDWLTEAQIVRSRKRIASLLDDAGQDENPDETLAAMLAGSDEDARTTLSAAARRKMPPRTEPLAREVEEVRAKERAPATPVKAPAAPLAPEPIAEPLPMVPLIPQAAPAPILRATPAAPLIADEMRSMRGFIEHQLATLAWRDGVSREPVRMRLLQDLIAAGLSAFLARSVIDHLPRGSGYEQAREWASQVLQRNLLYATPATDVTDQGGVFALVGPTGVGKTTTAAKIAARFAVKHGVDQLALITTDAYRIGAQDQLRIYGKILGIPVQTIHDEASLQSSLNSLARKKLVLIDTAGLSQRDDRVAEQIGMLRGVRAQRLVILNATVQAETLEETVRTYAANDCAGCILTKLDEAVRLGGVLDVVLRHRLKIHFVSNGQRVPEDIHHPNPAYLIHRALRVAAPNPIFDVTEAEHPAWLAAVAQSADAMRGAAHV